MNRARVVAGPRPMDVVWPGRGGARTPYPMAPDAGADDWVTPPAPQVATPTTIPPSTPQAPPQTPTTPPPTDGPDDWITPQEVASPEGVDDWVTPPDAQAPTPDAPKPPVDAPQATSNALPQFDRFTPLGGLGPDVATYGKVPEPEPEPVPAVAGLDLPPNHKFNTGGTALDKVLGRDTGMLTGTEAYESKYGRPARDATVDASGKPVPAQERVMGSIAEAEDRLAIARDNLDAARGDAATRAESPVANANFRKETRGRLTTAERQVEAAQAAVDAARKRPLDTQTGARSKTETGLQNVGQFAVESMAHVRGLLEVAAEREASSAKAGGALLGNPELAEEYKKLATDLGKFEDKTQALVDRSTRPDPAKAEDFDTKLTAGAVSMGIFMAGGVAARAIGISSAMGSGGMGALQMGGAALREVEDEAKKVSADIKALKDRGLDTTKEDARLKELLGAKYVALFANSALGATEAIPIERFLERLNAVPGASGKVAHILANTAKQSIEEVLQEVGQQIGQNVVANYLWDHGREIFGKDVTESGEIAFILGGIMGGGAGVHGAMRGEHLHGHELPVPPPRAPLDTDLTPINSAPTSLEVPPSKPAPTPPAPIPGAGTSPTSEPPKTAEEAAARLPPNPGTTKITINGKTVIVPPSQAGAPPGAPPNDAADISDVEHAVTSKHEPAKPGTSFTTAKGSTYEVHDDGTTTRNKSYHPEHGEQDQGPQPRSEKTVYVDSNRMGAFAIPENASWRIADHGDGTMSLVTRNPNGKWGVAPESKNIKVSDTPGVGLTPLELWGKERLTPHNLDAYSKMHPGNEITNVSQPPVAGTRQAPIEIKTDADIERIGDVVRQDHTAAQGEAHNVQHEHADWQGMGVTIEAPAGGIRRGTAPDGTPFEQTFTHPYGYLKGTKGADGMEVDAYLLGAEPQAFVLDELDENGKFRQHKVFLGAADSDHAREAYLGTQNKKPENWGGGRMMSAEELKDWSAGDMTKPVLTDRNRQSGEERNKVLRAYGYPQIQIDRMGEKERVKEFYDAVQAGVKAEDFKPAAPSEKPLTSLTSPTSNEGGKRDTSQEIEEKQEISPISQISQISHPSPEDVAAIDDAMRAGGEDPKADKFKDMAKRGAGLYAQHSAKGLSHADALRAAVAESMIDSGLLTEDQARQHYGSKVVELLQTERGGERGVREQAGQPAALGTTAAHAQGAQNGGEAGENTADRPGGKTNGANGQAAAASGAANGRGNLDQGATNARREQTAEARNPDGFFDRQQEDIAPKTESTEAQYVIPGAERISMKAHLERKAREPKRAPKRGSRVKSRVKEIEARGGPPPPSGGAVPAAPKTPRPPAPMSAMTYLASRGGLIPNPDLKKIGLDYRTRVVAPGMGWRNVLRKDGGATMDEAHERLIEGGYMTNVPVGRPADSNPHRLIYDMLRDELHGKPSYAQGEENADVEDRSRRETQAGNDEIAGYEDEVRAFLDATDSTRHIVRIDHFVRRAAYLMATEGLDVDTAWDLSVMTEDIDTVPTAEDEIHEVLGLGDIDDLLPNIRPVQRTVEAPAQARGNGEGPTGETEAAGSGKRVQGERKEPGSEEPAAGQDEVTKTKVPVPSTEKTPAGEQFVLPGTEKISAAEQAQRGADKKLKPKAAQNLVMDDGLFGDGHKQVGLVEATETGPTPSHTPSEMKKLLDDEEEQTINMWHEAKAPVPEGASEHFKSTMRAYQRALDKLGVWQATTEDQVRDILFEKRGERVKATKPETVDLPSQSSLANQSGKSGTSGNSEPAATEPEKAPEPSTTAKPAEDIQKLSAPDITEAEATRKLEEARQLYHRLKHTLDGMDKRLETPAKAKNSLDQLRLDENRKISERNARNLRKKVAEALDAVDDARKVRDAVIAHNSSPKPEMGNRAENRAKIQPQNQNVDLEEIPDFLLRKKPEEKSGETTETSKTPPERIETQPRTDEEEAADIWGDLLGEGTKTVPLAVPPAEKKKAAPKLKAEPSDWTEIGKNSIGQTLYEDQRGVRSYVENSVRITEPVQMRPTRAGMEMAVDRTGKPEWEVAKPDQQTELTDRPTEQKSYPPLYADTTGRVPQEAVNERVTQMIVDGFSPAEAQTKIAEMIRNAEIPRSDLNEAQWKTIHENLRDKGKAVVAGATYTIDQDHRGFYFTRREGDKVETGPETGGLQRLDAINAAMKRITSGASRERTAGEAAKSAVKNVSRGTSAAVEGLFQLFNTKNTLGVGITFDEETWKKAKPFFIQATKDFSGAWKDMRDFARKLLEALQTRGLHIDDIRTMRPYLEHFTVQVKRGEIDLTAALELPTSDSEHSSERTGPSESDQGKLDQLATEQGGRPEEGRGAERGGVGDGANGPVGNGRADEAGLPGTRGQGSGNGPGSKKGGSGRAAGLGKGRTGGNGARVPRKSPGEDRRGREPRGPVTPEQAPSLPAINFRITDEVNLGEGGEAAKFRDNLAAITTLKEIEREQRRATPDEQRILARYVGWGGLANAFRQPDTNEFKPDWKAKGEQLETALNREELRAARSSTQYAHYTSRTVIDAMWTAAQRLGFRGGLSIETSAGVGNFLGLVPDGVFAQTRFVAIEKDSISARIAKLLYPQDTVLHAPFEHVPLPDGEAALVIGNPPFSQHSLTFQNKPELTGLSMHNQFLLAGLDALRPHGVQIVVVSRYLMDSMDVSSREKMAVKADLIGAIRLPDTAFKENARTEVVTDILLFQRRTKAEEAEVQKTIDENKAAATKQTKKLSWSAMREAISRKKNSPSWIETAEVRDPLGGKPMRVNKYFSDNPKMIMGQLERSGTMQMSSEDGKGVNVTLNEPLGPRLAQAISTLPELPTLDHDVLAASLARHKSMSESLSIAMSGSEVGHVERDVDGKLTQISERETPSGDYELTRRELSPSSPWSRELAMDAEGRWYVMEPKSLAAAIDERIAYLNHHIAAGALGDAAHAELADLLARKDKAKPGELAKDGKRNIYVRKFFDNNEVPAAMRLGADKFERLTETVALRDLTKRQLTLEADDAPAAQMEGNRRALAVAYRAYVGKHGLLNDARNAQLINDLPDGAIVLALETGYRQAITNAKAARTGEKARPSMADPAPIMSQRVVPKYEPPTKADSAADALSIVLSESGRVNMERVASLLGTDEQGAIDKLTDGDTPLVYLDPETRSYEPRNAYLSGQVARKLAAARAAGLNRNATDLQAVLPARWTAENVTAIIGNNWIPPKIYSDFAQHLLGAETTTHYSQATNSFNLYVGNYTGDRQAIWGTEAMPADAILRGMLNSRVPKVMYEDENGTKRVDQELSTLVQLKAREIEAEFADWVFKDGDRRNQLVDIYNEKFNTRVTRQHDGSHLTLPGKVPDAVIKLRRHQKNAVWRGIYERFVLYDHVVGAGKTFSAIARAMERRRMGLSRKPLIAVPNHLVAQWTQDVYRLYPGAKVLSAGKNQFDRKNRRRLFARIATGDWDIIIVPHSSFGFIGIDPATESRFLEGDLAIAVDAVREANEQAAADGIGGRTKPFTVKQAEALVETITARMAKLKGVNKDRMLSFEQMGIDDLTVDESQDFKNLFYSSRLTGVRGMGDKAGSKKAFDLYNKVRVLRESPTGTITFMTGTPISNSAVEMFTIMRYLAAQELKDLGVENFDAWRSQSVSAEPRFEPTEAGGLKEVTRLGRSWSNMRALMELYYSFTDAVSQDDINKWYAEDNNGARFPIPKVKGGSRQEVIVKPTEAQLDALGGIIAGFNMLPDINDPKERNIARLKLMDRARKVSLDIRAVDPHAESKEVGGKLDQISDNVGRIYKAWSADRGTQLIFLDRSVKSSKGDDKIVKEYDDLVARRDAALRDGDEDLYRKLTDRLDEFDPNEIKALRVALQGGWNAYDQIKENLVKRGIPAEQIRFVQEANNDAEKKALFDLVREGTVRVLIGSTPRMGAGTNVQRRLVALHHADVTWKPSDIEQREGRIIRQSDGESGGLLDKYGDKFEVEILAYATERTVDAKMWDLNSTKLKMINGIRKYDGAFNMEFDDEEAVGMAEIAALASGDPLLLERVKLMAQLDKLEMMERSHRRKMFGIEDQIQTYERAQRDYPAMIVAGRKKAEILQKGVNEMNARASDRSVTIEGKKYAGAIAAQTAVTDAIVLQQGGDENARYAINVDDQRVTNRAGLSEAISNALGDKEPFEVIHNGETWRKRSQVAAELSKLATNAIHDFSGDEGQAGGKIGTLAGFDLNWDVTRGRWGDVVSLWLQHDGITLADGEKTIERGKTKQDVSTQLARSIIDNLEHRAVQEGGFTGDYLQRRIDEADERLPTLRNDQANAKFPQQAAMTEARARLNEVIKTLDERTKAAEGRGSHAAPPSTLDQPKGSFEQPSMFSLNREYNVVRDANGKIVAKPMYAFEPRGSLPLGMQAQMHVMRRGIVTGLEHLTAIDANGNVVESLLGNERSINISGKLLAALEDPNQSVVVHHNHPNDHGFSNPDISTLGHPGMAALWAHGHRGTIVRASLTPQARATFGRMPSVEARSRLFNAADRLENGLNPILNAAVAQKNISEADANRIEAHAVALILHRAGVIDYDFSLPRIEALMNKVPGLDQHINTAAGAAARELLHVIPTDRPASQVRGTLSHPGEVGTAFENARSRAAGPVGESSNQPSPAGDRADQGTTSPPLRFEARPPKRFRRAGTGTPPLPMPHFTPLHTNVRAALRDPTLSVSERYSAALGAMFLPAARKFWDKLIDLARMQRAAEMFNGAATPQRLDAHLAAILYPGITGERLKDASWDLFRPIYDAMKAHNVSPAEIQDYLYARHAEERNMVVGAISQPGDQFRLAMTDHSLVGGSGMSTDEANSILAHVAMRQADFDAVAALVDAVNAHNQNLMETEGLEHLSTLMTWNRAYQHYVPLRGEEVGSEDEHGSPPLGKGFSTRGPESMRALGRGTRAGSILAHLLDQTNRLIIRAEKNKVGKTFARWAIANPNPDLYKVGLGTVRRAVNPATGLVELEWVTTPAQSDRAFAFKVAGDTHYIEFAEGQEGMLLALKNLGVPRFGWLMRTGQWMTRTWSSFQTAKDPEFVTNNFERDIQEAGLAITAEQRAGFQKAYWKNLVKGRSFLAAVMGQVGATGNRYGQLYEDWRHDGGKISSFGWKDVDTIVKDIQREMTRRTESMAWKFAAQPWRIIDPVNGHIVHLFEALNDIMESTTRLAVYAAARDIGLTRAVAGAASRAMTVDFSRGGEAKGTIQALYAFANPAIQGQVNLVRRLKSRRFRYIYGVGIPSTAFMLTLYNLWASPADDDDEKKRTFYEEMKQWDRDQNIVFFIPGNKNAKKIPLNFMARPAWALGENAAMAMMGKIKPSEAIGNFLGSTAQAFIPLGSAGSAFDLRTWAKTLSPTMLDPLIELGFNRDWLNRPIHPDEANWNRGVPHSQQSKMTTSTHAEDVARGLNRMTGGSTFSKGVVDLYPDNLEYAWNFLLGGYGKFVLRGGDLIRDKIDGVDTPVEKIPFVRRFITEGGSEGQRRETYYEKHHEADEQSQQVRNAIRAERAGKNVEDAQKTIDELADKVGARVTGVRNGVPTVSTRAETAFRDADHKLSQLRAEERDLRRDKNLSRVERIQRVKTNRKEQLDIMSGARDRYQSVAPP